MIFQSIFFFNRTSETASAQRRLSQIRSMDTNFVVDKDSICIYS
jgi:hypothetical protein